MLCKKENQTKIYLCIADPCGLKKNLMIMAFAKMIFQPSISHVPTDLGISQLGQTLSKLFCFNIFTRYFRSIWWNIFLIKYVISNKTIFMLVMGIRFSNIVYNLIKEVFTYISCITLVCCFEIDHLTSLVLFWIKNQITLLFLLIFQ